jgi:hypothetical protein
LNHLPLMFGRRAVREVAARVEAQAHEGVARLEQRQEDGLVRLAAGVGCTLAKPQPNSCLARSMASCSTSSTIFAAAIIALAGIAFGIFVGEDRALRFEHRRETMFSDAISSICSCSRSSSLPIAAATSGHGSRDARREEIRGADIGRVVCCSFKGGGMLMRLLSKTRDWSVFRRGR